MKSVYWLRTVVNYPASPQGTRKVLNSTLTAIILHDEEEEVIPDERKAIFYAASELAVRYYFLFLNPDTQIHGS
jgi:hypothetical protein